MADPEFSAKEKERHRQYRAKKKAGAKELISVDDFDVFDENGNDLTDEFFGWDDDNDE